METTSTPQEGRIIMDPKTRAFLLAAVMFATTTVLAQLSGKF